jgi:hypothetical protein
MLGMGYLVLSTAPQNLGTFQVHCLLVFCLCLTTLVAGKAKTAAEGSIIGVFLARSLSCAPLLQYLAS